MKKNSPPNEKARVILTVTKFNPTTSTTPGTTTYTMALIPWGTTHVALTSGQLTIGTKARLAVDFNIEIASSPGDADLYLPVGVAFWPVKKGRRRIKTGEIDTVCQNFLKNDVRIRNGVLKFTDACDPCADLVTFEFSVFLQRYSDGLWSTIDPTIVHSESNEGTNGHRRRRR
jgi:hypothetical protein